MEINAAAPVHKEKKIIYTSMYTIEFHRISEIFQLKRKKKISLKSSISGILLPHICCKHEAYEVLGY